MEFRDFLRCNDLFLLAQFILGGSWSSWERWSSVVMVELGGGGARGWDFQRLDFFVGV